jgi:hypothetical protein
MVVSTSPLVPKMMRLARIFVVDVVKWQYPRCAPDWLVYEKHAAPGASVAGSAGRC